MPNSILEIASRLYFANDGKKRSSRPAVRVALAGIIVGILVMILTICIVVGFKQTVTDNIAGFDAHMQVVSFEYNDSYDLSPISVSDTMLACIGRCEHVTSASPFITKPGILKTDSAFMGIVLKGTDYWSFFADKLVEGVLPIEPQQVLLSRAMARQLQLHVGDPVPCYFIDDKDVRARKLIISGLYDSGFSQYDDLFVVTPLETLRSIQKWEDHIYSGIDIRIDDVANMEVAFDDVCAKVENHVNEEDYSFYLVKQLYEKNSTVFLWLDLLDMNVVIIIVLMLIVAGMNMVTGLIILILESVQLIGTLKALGANNSFIRRIFLTQASMLIVKGLIWGNVIGLGLAAMQYYFQLIPLESSVYYVNAVPIAFPWLWILLLNVIVVALGMLVLLLPSMIISKINPAKVMHFE